MADKEMFCLRCALHRLENVHAWRRPWCSEVSLILDATLLSFIAKSLEQRPLLHAARGIFVQPLRSNVWSECSKTQRSTPASLCYRKNYRAWKDSKWELFYNANFKMLIILCICMEDFSSVLRAWSRCIEDYLKAQTQYDLSTLTLNTYVYISE